MALERAKYIVQEALRHDEIGNEEEAFKLYVEAVEACIKAKAGGKIDSEFAQKIDKLAKQALERAEEIDKKRKKEKNTPENNVETNDSVPGANDSTPSSQNPIGTITSCPASASKEVLSQASTSSLKVIGNASYSAEEKAVLQYTSKINNISYLPFMSIDLEERFHFPLPFNDSNGLLRLSPKQMKSFSSWKRPGEMFSDPKLIRLIDCFSIRQTIISDCSFVASLAISALYEKKFKKRLITSIIYPQNRNGDPVYNPCGKYMVKLNFNGIPRKVIIDDLLPVALDGKLLCSYSSNRGELWVSLLEKAYLKVMGGYDFPGSNSNIDLHSLTGWIPERVSIHNDPDSPIKFNKDELFYKLLERIHLGHVLVTVATGEMSDAEAERAGLVSTHAYAILDIQEINGTKLFLLKNPWSVVRWKGNYSELDTIHWTPSLQKALKYDPSCASNYDNGVFWIDYNSICKFFDVFYLSWNPDIFSYTYCLHKSWSAGIGPVKDVYNIGDNPQYNLEIKSSGPSTVWILLTRHIMDIQDFRVNREYITVLVYDTDGKKIYYPYDPPPIIDGVRINSPHYLCKILVPKAGVHRYTLVVSQYEKMHTIHYTLRAYSTSPFCLREIVNLCKFKRKIQGSWKGVTAGGCANHPTYEYNPVYQIKLTSSLATGHSMIIDLKGPKGFSIGFDVICSNSVDSNSPYFFGRKTSGPYRSGFVVMELHKVLSGVYNIIPSTFLPKCEGPFILTVQSTCDFSINILPTLSQ